MTVVSQLFGQQVYARGAMALEALRTAIGAANFETLMRQYQLTYGGGQITGRRTAGVPGHGREHLGPRPDRVLPGLVVRQPASRPGR